MNKKLISQIMMALLMWTPNSWGVLTGITVPDYFNQTTSGTDVIIYAGRADDSTSSKCPSSNGDVPCDTCSSITSLLSTASPTPFLACNRKGIYSGLYFYVTFATDNAGPFTTASQVMMVSGTTTLVGTLVPPVTTITAGTPIKAQFKWGDICFKFGTGADANCNTSFTSTVQVGVSKDSTATLVDSLTLHINLRSLTSAASLTYHTNCSSTQSAAANEGVCGFNLKPGDGKVIVGDVLIPLDTAGSAVNSWPATGDFSGVSYAGVKVYYRKTVDQTTEPPANSEWQTIAPAAGGTIEANLDISADGSMSKTRIEGLDNESLYVFSIATYDQAGNISYFSNIDSTSNFFTVAGTHYGRPGEVVGLLSNKKCFIATAAYGSEMAPQVELLRQFRNEVMLKNAVGKYLVKTYYQWSPPAAEFISRHENLRTFSRGILSPIIGWAKFCLEYGILAGALLLLVIGLIVREILKRGSVLLAGLTLLKRSR